ncbi:MAG TPA: PEP-CTERM sorting domain-containing protein [Phycisphaerae bacterium]|nr:PEP-CTERM sorting domain-containing protein [Phycisphaerae bacterium]
MRKVAFAVLAAVIMTAPAMAELTHSGSRTGPIYTATPTEMVSQGERASTAAYDSLYAGALGYWSAPPKLAALGYDDYDTISGVNVTKAKFVGGLTRVVGLGGSAAVMWFEFYDPTSFNLLTTFGVLLGTPGNWIWTINMGATPFVIPHTALYQIVANTTFSGGGAYSITIMGQWFFTSSDALIVGSNNPAIGPPVITTTYATFPSVHDFSFLVPEPATLGLFGAGMLLLLRRRR